MAGEKILDIDDSPTVQRLIEMILSSQGYQVILASDGEEGIAKARSERPAVILVDFVMPKMNGFQVCKTLKDDPNFKDTPIILVTSKGDKVGSKFVDVLGITEYFTKPFQPEELLAKIREVIDKPKMTPLDMQVQEVVCEPLLETQQEPRQLAPEERPTPATGPGGIEVIVRSTVERILDEFISIRLPELIRKELARQQHEHADIRGSLASVRIVEVLQMLGLQRQTGRLAVIRSGEAVEIYLKDGLVVLASSNCNNTRDALKALLKRSCGLEEDSIARVMNTADVTAQPLDRVLVREKIIDPKAFVECLKRHTESAIFKVMAWEDGEFLFKKATPPMFADGIQMRVEDLLLEGARRADEWSLIRQKIPHFEIVFEPMIGNADELTTRGLSDVDIRVFSCIDGQHSIQEIINTLCMSEFDVVKSMFILLSVNLIRRRR